MQTWVALAVAIVALGMPARGRACGPFFEGAFFTYAKHPDQPFERYAGGQLGLVHPTFARSYLVFAYRTLAGHPLDEAQAAALAGMWRDRITQAPAPGAEIAEVWHDARAQVMVGYDSPAVKVHRPIPGASWGHYLACTPDAFETAAQTLDQLTAELGVGSPHVRAWVLLQDQVFANCGGDGYVVPTYHSDAAGPPPASVKAHRAYQAAAACFYAEQFPEAQRRFSAIAADPSSPWAAIAPYLSLRAAVRQATLSADGIDVAALAEIEQRIDAQLAAQPSDEVRPHLLGLKDYVAFRTHPAKQLAALSSRLTAPEPTQDMRHLVDDYTRLLDLQLSTASQLGSGDDDLTDWVLRFQGHRTPDVAHAFQRWTDTGSSAWLLAALTWATPEFGQLEYLLAGASAVEPNDPAYPTAAFHQARLLTATGREDTARGVLDAAIGFEALDEASRNALLAQRLYLARDLDEFVTLAPRRCVGVGWDFDGYIPDPPAADAPPMIDADAAALLTAAMPMALALDVARRDALPTEVRQRVALSVWVRAALIDEHAVGQDAARLAGELQPELAPYLADYVGATSDPDRHHAAIFALLQLPGATPLVIAGLGRRGSFTEIDSYRDNWWAGPLLRVHTDWEVTPVSFLDEAQLATLTDEHERLLALPIAPDLLCEQAIALAEALPDDPRAPHALHLAVKATRYTTTGAETGDWSKRAFELLQGKYAGTRWAEKTPYWYK